MRPRLPAGARAHRAARSVVVWVTVCVTALAVLGALSACSLGSPPPPESASSASAPQPSVEAPSPPTTAAASPTTPPTAPPASEQRAAPIPLAVGLPPASVSLPSIGLDEPLIDLGLQPDGSMEVPTDFADVGWFTPGGRPGGRGPTVIAGHVDSAVGPAVFFDLRELEPGDPVQVTDTAGSVFDYTVTRVGDYPKAAFPTAEVFGALPSDELRLITCTGLFDTSVGHYEDNRVVFASRTP